MTSNGGSRQGTPAPQPAQPDCLRMQDPATGSEPDLEPAQQRVSHLPPPFDQIRWVSESCNAGCVWYLIPEIWSGRRYSSPRLHLGKVQALCLLHGKSRQPPVYLKRGRVAAASEWATECPLTSDHRPKAAGPVSTRLASKAAVRPPLYDP